MGSKQRAHSPAGCRLESHGRDGTYHIGCPSESRPGKWHTLLIGASGRAFWCGCEGYKHYLDYLASVGTSLPLRERKPCWHVLAAADILAHVLQPSPPADPGGALGEPPEPAGPTEREDAARDERRRRYAESMANLYGG